MKRFDGKNVLVTGGISVIGRSIAVEFAEEGANEGGYNFSDYVLPRR